MPRLTVTLDGQVMFDREIDECAGKEARGGKFEMTASWVDEPRALAYRSELAKAGVSALAETFDVEHLLRDDGR